MNFTDHDLVRPAFDMLDLAVLYYGKDLRDLTVQDMLMVSLITAPPATA